MKFHDQSEEKKSLHPNKKRTKRFSPYKKNKYALSKLEEYENYLNNIELMSRGGNLES